MATTTVKFEGMDTVTERLKQLGDEAATSLVDDALLTGALIVKAEAARNAPRRTGALSRGLMIQIDSSGGRRTAKVGTKPEVFYGLFVERGHKIGKRIKAKRGKGRRRAADVELGTSRVPAQPFLAPALKSTRGQVKAAIAAVIRRRLGL